MVRSVAPICLVIAEGSNMENQEIVWVSVRERLPHYGQVVLAYLPNNWEKIKTVNVYNSPKSEGGIAIGSYFESVKVTHWAKLPNPPKEKGVEPLKKSTPIKKEDPHKDGDYSVPCGRDYCKCMQ